jgi:hypothetical protein
VYRLSQTAKFRSLRNLPLEALYLLGRESVPAATLDAVAERAEAGETTTPETVRFMIKPRVEHRAEPVRSVRVEAKVGRTIVALAFYDRTPAVENEPRALAPPTTEPNEPPWPSRGMPPRFFRLFDAISEIGEVELPDAKELADQVRSAGRHRPANLELGDLREVAQLLIAIATEPAPVSVPAVVVDEDNQMTTIIDAELEAPDPPTKHKLH